MKLVSEFQFRVLILFLLQTRQNKMKRRGDFNARQAKNILQSATLCDERSLSPDRYIYWAQLSMFHLKTEPKSNLRNGAF